MSGRICVFHPGSLGDAVLSLSALRLLRNTYPRHDLVWYGHSEIGKLLLLGHELDESHSFDQTAFHSVNPWRSENESESIGDGQSPNHRAVFWMNDREGWWEGWCREKGVKDMIRCSPLSDSLKATHISECYLETLAPWIPMVLEPGSSSFSDLERPLRFPSGLTVSERQTTELMIHPGSGSPHKCASPEFFEELILVLLREGWENISLVGGPADNEALDRLQYFSDKNVQIIQGLDLCALSERLLNANVFIGHDSGLSHLAVRLGIPALLLFGPTDPCRWAPKGAHVRVVKNFCGCANWSAVQACSQKPCLNFSTLPILRLVRECWDTTMNASPHSFLGAGNQREGLPCHDS